MGRAGHLLPGCQAERSHCTTQVRLTMPGDGGDGRPPFIHSCFPGTAAEVVGSHLSCQGAQTMMRLPPPRTGPHRGGKVVHTTWPPRALIGGETNQATVSDTEAKGSHPSKQVKFLTQVGPLSQFSRSATEEQGWGGSLGEGHCSTTENRRGNNSPSQRT